MELAWDRHFCLSAFHRGCCAPSHHEGLMWHGSMAGDCRPEGKAPSYTQQHCAIVLAIRLASVTNRMNPKCVVRLFGESYPPVAYPQTKLAGFSFEFANVPDTTFRKTMQRRKNPQRNFPIQATDVGTRLLGPDNLSHFLAFESPGSFGFIPNSPITSSCAIPFPPCS